MRRWLDILFMSVFCIHSLLVSPQTTDNSQAADDTYLMLYLQRQLVDRMAANDSLYQYMLLNDTTTAFPFHIGFRDSITIAEKAKKEISPLTLPLVYIPEQRLSFYDSVPKPDTVVNIYTIRRDARRYLATHCAGIYTGVLDTMMLQELHYYIIEAPELSVKIPKSMIADSEGERMDSIYRAKTAAKKWAKEADVMLQLTQNYVSKNWYQGGNPSFAMLGILKGFINYDDKKRITWENSGEWHIGLNTVSGDTLRKVNANDDIIKLYTKFGVKIVPKVKYTFSSDIQTQFFNTWKENSNEVKSGPFTPLKLNIATGIDYQPVAGLSLYFAPLTYKMVYAADTIHALQTSFGIPSGQKILNEAGSSLRVDWKWQPLREISISSLFYLYTNYKRVEIDWEITTDFIINRYFSARLVLHPRYDNTVIYMDDEKARIQFKELISLGFSHKFR